MRIALLISLGVAALVGGGCGWFTRHTDPDLPYAQEAKAALLDLMRGDENPFHESLDPQWLQVEPLVLRAPGRYAWGPFDLDLVRRVYRAEILTAKGEVFAYAGAFKVDPEGRWTAKWPESRQRDAPPPPPPAEGPTPVPDKS